MLTRLRGNQVRAVLLAVVMCFSLWRSGVDSVFVAEFNMNNTKGIDLMGIVKNLSVGFLQVQVASSLSQDI